MKIHFRYCPIMDIDNFLITLNSKNNSKKTALQVEFNRRYGSDYSKKNLEIFIKNIIQEKNINIEKHVEEIKKEWKIIQSNFFSKVEQIFGPIKDKRPLIIYLTTNQRCSYNIESNYFYLFLGSKNRNAIIMHELFHFYTHHNWRSKIMSLGLEYNEIKESLTVLLNNHEFKHLMNDTQDTGYILHQNLRKKN